MAYLAVFLALVVLCVAVFRLKYTKKSLKHIPGPDTGSLLLGHIPLVDFEALHRNLADWSRKYGSVYKLRLLHKRLVVVSGQEALHEMLVKKGIETGGRPDSFRAKYVTENTGIILNLRPDARWKALRKTTQKHLKQFGDGMSRLEQLIASVGDDLLEDFRETEGAPCDPRQTLLNTVMKSISFLLTGKRAANDDPLLDLFKRFEVQQQYFSTDHPIMALHDFFPWLRYLRLKTWQPIEDIVVTRDKLWDMMKQITMAYPENDSLAKLLLSKVSSDNSGGDGNFVREIDAKLACAGLIFAGTSTTAYTSYALINLLAHNPSVQEEIYQETCKVLPDGFLVTLENKPRMPYTTATILEAVRYISTVALGVPHRSISDVEISGILIPNDTLILTNLWALHHNPDVWGDPDRFRPERFLDDDGHLVPADHIYRKNLMPFGAGTRVCVGESLALTRLFLWIARLIQRFDITPAEGNDCTITFCENYTLNGVLMESKPYRVHFSERR